MKPAIPCFLGTVLCLAAANAQIETPLPRPDEQKIVDDQTAELCQSLAPILSTAAKSTVRIWTGKRLLAYGTAVGQHKVLTKWSEISRASDNLVLTGSRSDIGLSAKIAGVYEDEDLAMLETGGSALTPIQWSKETPKLGAFLAAPQPDGKLAAFGVVSVQERNLRASDQAYIGFIPKMDFPGPGVKIEEVAPESGAAAAGLKPGNIILKVGDRPISGLLELKNALAGKPAGSSVSLVVKTSDGEKKISVQLSKHQPLPDYPGDRLRQMEHMGGALSQVRDSFTHVLQSDMRPQPDQIGGPVVDLKGRVVGITMARADRTRSFIMPSAAVENLLRTPPHDPTLAQVRRSARTPAAAIPGRRQALPQDFQIPGDPENTRRHIQDMQRLMDFMLEEMDGLEPNR